MVKATIAYLIVILSVILFAVANAFISTSEFFQYLVLAIFAYFPFILVVNVYLNYKADKPNNDEHDPWYSPLKYFIIPLLMTYFAVVVDSGTEGFEGIIVYPSLWLIAYIVTGIGNTILFGSVVRGCSVPFIVVTVIFALGVPTRINDWYSEFKLNTRYYKEERVWQVSESEFKISNPVFIEYLDENPEFNIPTSRNYSPYILNLGLAVEIRKTFNHDKEVYVVLEYSEGRWMSSGTSYAIDYSKKSAEYDIDLKEINSYWVYCRLKPEGELSIYIQDFDGRSDIERRKKATISNQDTEKLDKVFKDIYNDTKMLDEQGLLEYNCEE